MIFKIFSESMGLEILFDSASFKSDLTLKPKARKKWNNKIETLSDQKKKSKKRYKEKCSHAKFINVYFSGFIETFLS